MKFQINLMLFIFLLGAVEIVPLFLGHITGKQYPLASQLQPPIGEGGGVAAGDAEGSPSGQGAAPGDSLEGSTARTSEIERLKEVRKGRSTSIASIVCTVIFHPTVCEGGVPRRDARGDVAAADLFSRGFSRGYSGPRVGRHPLLRLRHIVARRGRVREHHIGE